VVYSGDTYYQLEYIELTVTPVRDHGWRGWYHG
jgi:hypothetical protein